MLEKTFQAKLIKTLKDRFPNSIVLKTDPTFRQGFPDLIILYKNKWATLECKKSFGSSVQPNQQYYVDILNHMSYSSFIYPENMEEVLDEMEKAFGLRRTARVSRS